MQGAWLQQPPEAMQLPAHLARAAYESDLDGDPPHSGAEPPDEAALGATPGLGAVSPADEDQNDADDFTDVAPGHMGPVFGCFLSKGPLPTNWAVSGGVDVGTGGCKVMLWDVEVRAVEMAHICLPCSLDLGSSRGVRVVTGDDASTRLHFATQSGASEPLLWEECEPYEGSGGVFNVLQRPESTQVTDRGILKLCSRSTQVTDRRILKLCSESIQMSVAWSPPSLTTAS